MHDQYPNDKWVDIAYTPAQAEQIMAAGHLAIVLGVEVDDLMRCGRLLCSPTEVDQKLQRLHALGVRHVFPIHGIDNGFGGSGFFNEFYGLQNWVYHPWANWFDLRECTTPNASFRFRDTRGFSVESFGTGNRSAWLAGNHFLYHPLTEANGEWYLSSHCNVKGLTVLGEHLVQSMMQLGMLIDVDHMSERSFDGVHTLATNTTLQSSLDRTGDYPLVASHIGIRDMRPDRTKKSAHLGNGLRNGNVGGEAHKSVAQIQQIAATGGLVAPILTQAETDTYANPATGLPFVVNNCTDSSRSWAQVYLRALALMNNKNVALATDVNGQAPMPGPRFGQDACASGKWRLLEASGSAVSRPSSRRSSTTGPPTTRFWDEPWLRKPPTDEPSTTTSTAWPTPA